MGQPRKKQQATAAVVDNDISDDAVAAALAMADAEIEQQADADAELNAAIAAVMADEEAAKTDDTIWSNVNDDPDGGSAFIEPEIVDEGHGGIDPEDVDIDAALAELDAAEPAPAPTKSKAKKPRKTAAPTTTKAPPAPTREFSDVAKIDAAELKANLDALNAKKVIEKAQNVIEAVTRGKKLSRYTLDAASALKRDGKITGKSLVDEFVAKGLGIGTARAQAQQMTALFKAFGIVLPDPTTKELVISDTGLVDELVKLAA